MLLNRMGAGLWKGGVGGPIVRISELTLPPGEHFGPLNDVG